MKGEKQLPLRRLVRNFLIELVFYALLVVAYFALVLSFLGEPLAQLYQENLPLYALACLGLVVAQAVLLDFIVTFLLDLLGMDRLK